MTIASSENELVDVVDAAGDVTATVPRWQVRRDNLLHRSVFVAVVNGADELLVHRRADWKDVWPSYWDVAFGGIVDPGEPWEAAASRELAEEAGITAELAYLGEGRYEDDVVRELARVYLARHDGPVSFHDGEVSEIAWVPLAGVRAWLEGRDICPDSRELVLPRLDAP